jgi:RNA polymerase sigma-70 factor (ECF subfamily)
MRLPRLRLQRARAALEERLPTADRERAPRPNSARERRLVGRFADAVESGGVDGMVSLLTDDAWVTMPPQPLEYQGHEAIAALLRYNEERRCPLRVVPRANTQPAFGCYVPDTQMAVARAYGLMVLTLEGDRISAIWFGGNSVFPYFGLPRTRRLSR